MKRFRLISLALVLAMLFTCVPALAEVTYPVAGDVTLTMMRTTDPDIVNAGYTSYNDAPGFKAWQEATGVTVKMNEVADATAMLLALASGDLPDIILGGKDFYTGGQIKMEEDGMALDLTDKLPQSAPDYWNFINSDPGYINSIKAANGKVYAVAGYCWPKDSPFRSWRGFIWRQDLLDKLKVSAPTTADEFYDVLKRMKSELNIETPFICLNTNFTNMLNDGALTSPFGLVNAAGYVKDGKYHYGAYDNEYKDVLTFLNKLYTEKLLDQNFAVTDEPTAQSGIINGTSGVIYAANSRINNMTKAATTEGFKLAGGKALACADGSRAMYGLADPYVSGSYWCFVTSECKNVDAALNFLNYPFTENGKMLANFGTEGVSYTMEDGNPKFTDLIVNNPDGYALDPILRAYSLLNFAHVRDDRMSQQRFPLQEQIDAYAAWADTDVDKYRPVNDSILPEYIDEYSSLWVDIDTYISESRAKFISGATALDEFDSYISTLKTMGMDRIIEIRQASLDAFSAK